MSNVQMFTRYDTKLMTEVWSSASAFLTDYQNAGIPTTINNQNATTLYYLLYAKYGNTPIANYDENQWKYKMFSIIFQYGPTWEKRLDIQNTLRGFQISDLVDNGSFRELFSHSGSESSSKTGSDNNTRTLNTTEKNTGTSTLANTGTDTTISSGTQDVVHTGTSELKNKGTDTTSSTGTQDVTHTGTSSVANTGTDTTASTGTQSVSHTGTVVTAGETEDIKNHAYNPSTAPAQNAYSPLGYINEQNATKNNVDNTVTNNLTDTTTNDLQNQTSHNTTSTTTNDLTDKTTNNLQNQITHDTTSTTTNNLTDKTTNELRNELTHDTTSTTTNDLSRSDTGTITDARAVTDSVKAENKSQNETTTVMTAGKLKAYEKLLELLETDVTGDFISKFKICFKQFVMPERTFVYVTEEEEENV